MDTTILKVGVPVKLTAKQSSLYAAEIDQLRAENERLKSDYKALQCEYRKQNDVETALVKAIDELSNRAEQAERERDKLELDCGLLETELIFFKETSVKRDIEQQIKALEWVITNECMGWYEVNRIQRRIRQLRAQLEGK